MTCVAFYRGSWISATSLALPIDDLGFVQAVTVVERLRTWSGHLHGVDAHLDRLERSAEVLRIRGLPSRSALADLIAEVVRRNRRPGEDTGITVWATPGRPGGGEPTLCLHPTPIDSAAHQRWRHQGQPLVITPVRQPPPDSWPRDVKVRCRIHFYLADHFAADQDPLARGVLIDQDGSITETSTSNILLLVGGRLVLPPVDRVLPGVMAGTLCALAARHGIAVERRVIMPDELRSTADVWMTSAIVGLWPASHVDGVPKPIGADTRLWQRRLDNHLRASAADSA